MRRALQKIALTLTVLLAALTIYGVAIEPRLILATPRHDVTIPGLDESWDGATVAALSDMQTGMWWANTHMVDRAVRTVVEEDPDLVLLPGDFLYSEDPSIEHQVQTVVDQLRPLVDAQIPTVAVLGNHDHATGGADEIARALEELGIPVLENDALEVTRRGGAHLHVVGLAATRPGLTDVDAALSGVPPDAPRLVMMHNPTVFQRLPEGSAPLAVAGHTHCGQVALPGPSHWSYLALTDKEQVVADHWAPPTYGADGNRLFVTCGIGFSLAPVRINAPPEVAFFTLHTPSPSPSPRAGGRTGREAA
ncbi:metallophosphoesterase [Promicromonospora iranensis]|uniref:MPP superfamily phosphohydrolase n=1 Tax=Promicromonospora iranensis TaxID=1105144 RepID=A0ABU2CHI4_9MICO|nr:metallophosphoesterase [Promicromonospora iranensis]MDR7380793.1 putative MPP superfamily phosphohydrolase [Promicromonospora iranensis]